MCIVFVPRSHYHCHAVIDRHGERISAARTTALRLEEAAHDARNKEGSFVKPFPSARFRPTLCDAPNGSIPDQLT